VTSERKRRANRANARLSTGPKTVQGKARAAKNALRHGLSLSVLNDPAVAAEVETLAPQIAGTDVVGEVVLHARRVAEAQIDVQRVRLYRQRRMVQALNGTAGTLRDEAVGARKAPSPDAFAAAIGNLARELEALDRYERRALSRRKFAIRAFDQACVATRE